MCILLLGMNANAQINSGSNGTDGVFNPTTNIVINMADHPTGIYQYTSVNISNGVTVTFIPNANNSPVTWLVQSNVVINGTVDLSGKNCNGAQGGLGGPGGYSGGFGGSGSYPISSSGLGAGGGPAGYFVNSSNFFCAGQASFGTVGGQSFGISGYSNFQSQGQAVPGSVYGNKYLLPLVGGSGGGGLGNTGGGGGGGAILIAANGNISINSPGTISANGGSGVWDIYGYVTQLAGMGGGGSGGAIRLVSAVIAGNGGISVGGGQGLSGYFYNSFYQSWFGSANNAGNGRIRFDTYQNNYGGSISGAFTFGAQFVIVPITGQIPQLTVTSIGGIAVSASPAGALSTPDAVLSAQQNNPIPVVVSCANLPLNTQITVSVKPSYGTAVTATGYNTTGTLVSSTATISIVIPRGGGLIYATAATAN